MQRTRSWVALFAAVVAGLGLHCGEDPLLRPNLLLITTEEVRPDDLPCYDPTAENGHGMCDLAEQGGRFVWAFSPSPTPGPAAATLLTGRSPDRHGVSQSVASFLPDPETTLAELLQQGGYATAAFVSNAELNRSRHFHQGFDRYRDRIDLESVVEAAQGWADSVEAPWFIWAHLIRPETAGHTQEALNSAAERLRLDRSVTELIAALSDETRPRGVLLTSLHGRGDSATRPAPQLDLPHLRVPLFWQAPNSSNRPGVTRKIRTPVSLADVAPTLIEAAALSFPETTQMDGAPLPYADLPKRPSRTLLAKRNGETLIIHGAEWALFSPDSHASSERAPSGRLWPASDPSSEKTPARETQPSSRARHKRLTRLLQPGTPGPDQSAPVRP